MGWQAKLPTLPFVTLVFLPKDTDMKNAFPQATTYGRKSKGYSECRPLHKYCVYRRIRLGFFSLF